MHSKALLSIHPEELKTKILANDASVARLWSCLLLETSTSAAQPPSVQSVTDQGQYHWLGSIYLVSHNHTAASLPWNYDQITLIGFFSIPDSSLTHLQTFSAFISPRWLISLIVHRFYAFNSQVATLFLLPLLSLWSNHLKNVLYSEASRQDLLAVRFHASLPVTFWVEGIQVEDVEFRLLGVVH